MHAHTIIYIQENYIHMVYNFLASNDGHAYIYIAHHACKHACTIHFIVNNFRFYLKQYRPIGLIQYEYTTQYHVIVLK